MKAHRLVITFAAVASVAALIGAGAAATSGPPTGSTRSTREAKHSMNSTAWVKTQGDAPSRPRAPIGCRRSRPEATR